MEYIGQMKEDECFLCDAVGADPAQDAQNLVLWRGPHSFAICNRFPYTNGHLLIAPTQHKAELHHLTQEELLALVNAVCKMQLLLKSVMQPDGFNVGLNVGRAAGAGLLQHLHIHIVPRWEGDTNFMPVLGDAKIIPESLSALYKRLREALEKDSCPG
jgi:ATP adenylyltransferase